ncbi:TLDc domain [Trichophyton rubrum]|nr:TLDc domain [Trichophyton rubrum]
MSSTSGNSSGYPRSSNSRSQQPQQEQPSPQSTSSYLTYPVSHVVSGIYRRLTEPGPPSTRPLNPVGDAAIFTPPRRTASPFHPPPLTPLTLECSSNDTDRLLTRSLAEEIRLLIPPRLQLVDTWKLVYNLDRDGASLSTLYDKCREHSEISQRAGYLLVVRDSSSSAFPGTGNANSSGGPTTGGGSLFGAYLTDAPHPDSHYYGTGECFLWRASTLSSTPIIPATAANGKNTKPGQSLRESLEQAGLPPPPSADTTNIRGRNTTFRGSSRSGTHTPEHIRFKAFPYSGVNDYMIFCETGFLSVGGGDGHYGLWLDDSFEKGVSSPCLTFGNEPLSDEGTKFDVLAVEVWSIG